MNKKQGMLNLEGLYRREYFNSLVSKQILNAKQSMFNKPHPQALPEREKANQR